MKTLGVIVKTILLIIGVFAALLALAMIGLQVPVVRAYVVSKALQAVNSSGKQIIALGEIQGLLPLEGVFGQVTVTRPGKTAPWLTIDSARVVWDPLALLHHTLHFPTVEVGSAVYYIDGSGKEANRELPDIQKLLRACPVARLLRETTPAPAVPLLPPAPRTARP